MGEGRRVGRGGRGKGRRVRRESFFFTNSEPRIEEDENELDDETGWKLLNADVFRAPRWPSLFCVLFGSGVQVLGMAVITMST